MLRHVLRLIGKIGDQPRCYYALTAAYCELVGQLKGKTMAFRCNFVDGPWAGQSVTLDQRVPRFEVGRARDPKVIGSIDSFFRYEPGPSKMVNGIEEAEFKITYDGPTHTTGGTNA